MQMKKWEMQGKVRIIIHDARKIGSTLRYRNLQFSLRKKKGAEKLKQEDNIRRYLHNRYSL